MADKPRFDGEKVRLGDVCALVMGQSPSSTSYNADSAGLPFYQGNTDFGAVHPEAKTWCTDPKKVAEQGDVLISVRAPIGAINVADERCCIGRGIAALRPHEGLMSQEYLVHLLQSNRKALEAMGTGSTFKAIGKKALSNFEISLHDPSEQQTISAQLGQVLACIKLGERQFSLLDTLVKSRFVEMFGDPIEHPKWELSLLKDICSKLGSGATPRGGKSAYKASGIPLIRSMNVHNGAFISKELAHIDDEQAEKLKGVTLEKGDVLLNITGASVARSCVLPDELAGGRVNQHVAIVRADSNRILPCVLNATFINASFQRFLLNGSRMAGATREAITKEDLKNMSVPIPPLSLQQEFADFVAQVDKSRFVVQQQIDKLQTLYDSLAQEYFA